MTFRYLPEGYKRRIHWTEKGRTRDGRASPKGTVLQGEHWDGSLDAKVRTPAVSVKVKDAFDQAGIPWTTITLPTGRRICLPKRAVELDSAIVRTLLEG